MSNDATICKYKSTLSNLAKAKAFPRVQNAHGAGDSPKVNHVLFNSIIKMNFVNFQDI